MSAITGIYLPQNAADALEQGRQLMKGLRQFPADDVQTWHREGVFLGCHAQWITPESVGEWLPYYDPVRRLAITADVIIDNRKELFEWLRVEHLYRRQMTDSQLILLAYSKWGNDCPKYLVGDFAFVIWDERNQRLFGARDFSGGRTLYYYTDPERFAFCTTIKPLLALPGVSKRLDEMWLAEFLAIMGMNEAVDTSLTPYQDIAQLPPSYSFAVGQGKVTLARYCTIHANETLKLKSNDEYVEAFQEVFQEAVDARLRTFRNVGAQLSGGLDSGAIASYAARSLKEENKPLYTFSYIPANDFEDFTNRYYISDESPFIRSVVEHVGGIDAHYLDFPDRDSFTEIDRFLEMMEMPYKFFENSYWLSGMFEVAAEKGVGLLLNGGRGNLSISWGSAIEYYAELLKRFRWIRLIHELNQYSQVMGGARLGKLPGIAKVAFPTVSQLLPSYKPYILPQLIHPDFAKRTDVHSKLRDYGIDKTGWFAGTNIYRHRKKHFADLFHWNASNTLASKLSLRHSLWKRDPSNDLRVIRFCLSLPEEQYVQNGRDRALIRRATEHYLPDIVRLNQQVRGAQGVDWVHRMQPHWNAYVYELEQMCNDPIITPYINGVVIKEAIHQARSGVNAHYVMDPNSKILMRALIVYRFIQSLERR